MHMELIVSKLYKVYSMFSVIILSMKLGNKDQTKKLISYTCENISNKEVISKNILKLYKEFPEIEKRCKYIINQHCC